MASPVVRMAQKNTSMYLLKLSLSVLTLAILVVEYQCLEQVSMLDRVLCQRGSTLRYQELNIICQN